MLEQQGNALPFEAFFTESKLGKAGLTVTVDVYEDLDLIISSGVALPVEDSGLYYYELPAINVNENALYSAVFRTETTSVDQQEVPALWIIGRDWVNNVDATISSRATPAEVWTYVTRTLTSSGSSLTAAEVWSYATRTITGLSITPQDLLDALTETTVNIRRGDTYIQTFNSPEVLSGYTTAWYTIKNNLNRTEADSESIVQIKKNASGSGDGLLYVNGAPAADASLGTISVDTTNNTITVEIHQTVTDDFIPVVYKPFDIQILINGDTKTIVDGSARIYGDVTRSLT